MNNVFSIVGLQRPKRDTNPRLGAELDTLVAKVLSLSEVAQIARAEMRLRTYLSLKWDARALQSIRVAGVVAARGARPEQVTKAVREVMERWKADVAEYFMEEVERMYRLARRAGWRKANKATKASLQYDAPLPSTEPVQKAKAQALPSFDLADEQALDALKKHQLFWLGEHYENNVNDGIAKAVHDVMIAAGGDRRAAAKALIEELSKELHMVRTPRGFNGTDKQYFDGLVANAATVARAHGQMRSFMDVGITTYEIVNPIDERTCPVCKHMDGKVFQVKQGADQMHAELKAKTPDQVRLAHPWHSAKSLGKISAKPGKAGAADAAALAGAGFSLPPFHFRCRCTVDISEEAGSYTGLTPMDPPTPTSPARPKEDEAPKPAARETAEDRVLRQLDTGKLVSHKAIGKGVNGAQMATLEADGKKIKAVMKSADSEQRDLRPGITAGTYYQREAVMHTIDKSMGGKTVVPPTVARDVVGVKSSLQAYVPGAKPWMTVADTIIDANIDVRDIQSVRRTFLLDVISANDDRHLGNILFTTKKVGDKLNAAAVAIDNGLTFPKGMPIRFLFPAGLNHLPAVDLLALDAASAASVKKLKLDKVAELLYSKVDKISREAVRATLVRIRAVQVNPEAIRRIYDGAKGQLGPADAVMRFFSQAHESPDALLDAKEIKAIDAILDKLAK